MKPITFLPQLCLATILTLPASPVLFAQQAAEETLQQRNYTPSQNTTPSLPTGAASSDLGQIGVVQEIPKPQMFSLSTSQQFFYTDNVFYTNEHSGTVGSLAYLGNYTGSFVPYALPNWTPRITLQYNMVRYNSVASGDFDNENAAFSSQYVFGDDRSWSWTATINLGRYTDPHENDHEFYKEVVYDNQINNVQRLIKNIPLFLVSAYDISYHQANPGIFDRLDNSLSFGCVYYPIPQLSLGPYVRPGARIYTSNGTYIGSGLVQNDRDDFNLAVGFDVTWQPWKYVSVSADFSHVNDYSNNSALGYSDTSPGLALTGSVQF